LKDFRFWIFDFRLTGVDMEWTWRHSDLQQRGAGFVVHPVAAEDVGLTPAAPVDSRVTRLFQISLLWIH